MREKQKPRGDDAWGKSIRTYEIAQMEGRWKRRGINKSIRTYEIKQMREKEDQMRGRTKVAGDFLSMPCMEKKGT
jgi:hypothetical protein